MNASNASTATNKPPRTKTHPTHSRRRRSRDEPNNDPVGVEGILLVNKPAGVTSFHLVAVLRRRLGVSKIGHAGTLDPFATGVMVMLVGRRYTRMADSFLHQDKEYQARIKLGVSTDSYDCDGKETATSEIVPTLEQVEEVLTEFQGAVLQTPPMFSAKKVGGRKLYELARKGKEIERQPVKVTLETELIHYEYPFVDIRVSCSKGTYVRSIANDVGQMLGCGAHLSALTRTRSGNFHAKDCIDGALLEEDSTEITLMKHASCE